MTQEDLERRKLREQYRHNRAQEEEASAERQEGTKRTILGQVIGAMGKLAATRGKNHFEWYNHDPELATRVGEVSSVLPLYENLNTFHLISGNLTSVTKYQPGFAVYDLMFTLPKSTAAGKYDPAYAAFMKQWIKTRAANSGARNYEPGDVAIRQIALGIFLAEFEAVKRSVRILKHMDMKATNRYYDGMILNGMYSPANSYEEDAGQVPNLEFRLQAIASRAKSLTFPMMSLYSRWVWLMGTVFKDENEDKTPFHFFVPARHWRYQLVTPSQNDIPMVVPQAGRWRSYDITQQIEFVELLLDDIMRDSLFITMMGDIAKAFASEVAHVDCDLSEQIYYYDDSVIDQIRNMAASCHLAYTGAQPNGLGNFTFRSIKGAIHQGQIILDSSGEPDSCQDIRLPYYNAPYSNFFLRYRKDGALSKEDLVTSTRLVHTGYAASNYNVAVYDPNAGTWSTSLETGTFLAVNNCGTEIVVDASIGYRAAGSTALALNCTIISVQTSTSNTQNALFSGFVNYPTIMDQQGGGPLLLGNSDNFVTIATDVLSQMHYVAGFSEFWAIGAALTKKIFKPKPTPAEK